MYNRKYRKKIGHNKEAMNCANYQYYILLSKQCWHNNSYQMRIKACLYVVEFSAVARALIGGGGVYSYIQVLPD